MARKLVIALPDGSRPVLERLGGIEGATKPKSANIHGRAFSPAAVIAAGAELLESVREVVGSLTHDLKAPRIVAHRTRRCHRLHGDGLPGEPNRAHCRWDAPFRPGCIDPRLVL